MPIDIKVYLDIIENNKFGEDVCVSITNSLDTIAFAVDKSQDIHSEVLTILNDDKGSKVKDAIVSAIRKLKVKQESDVNGLVLKNTPTTFTMKTNLRNAVVPTACQILDTEAFEGMEALDHVTISPLTNRIAESSFEGCESLETIVIPDIYMEIGPKAFKDCGSIREINLPHTISILSKNDIFESEEYSYPSEYGELTLESLFEGCDNLGDVTLPNNLWFISKRMFFNSGLDSISGENILKNINGIHQYAFSESKLESIDIPNNVEYIDTGAFKNCASLTEADISGYSPSTGSERYSNIPSTAIESLFEGCQSLAAVTMYDITGESTPLGKRMFYGCSSLRTVNLPAHVTLGEQCFSECTSLVSIGQYDTTWEMTNIMYTASRAFENCTNLYSITIAIPNLSSSQYLVRPYCFAGCSSLRNVKFIYHDNIKPSLTVDNYAFKDCTALDTVLLPYTVSRINQNAFEGCTSLKIIAFDYVDGLTTQTPQITTIGSNAFYGCTSLETISLPDTITDISANMFYGCTSLNNISMYGIKRIYGNAFKDCTSLTSIDIPSTITSINSSAFSGCTNLTSITIDKRQNSISGAPWGATNATVTWTGS